MLQWGRRVVSSQFLPEASSVVLKQKREILKFVFFTILCYTVYTPITLIAPVRVIGEEFTFCCVQNQKENKRRIGTNSLFFKFLCQAIIVQKQKNRTLARQVIHGSRSLYGDYHELLAPSSLKHVNASATIQCKIKINYSKTSSNLDLPRSMVFVVLFPSINFCVGDAKHIANNQKQV